MPEMSRKHGLRLIMWVVFGVGLAGMSTVGSCHYLGLRAQADGETYVRRFVEPSLWDAESLIRLASSDLLTEVPPDQLSNAIRKIGAGLGPLRAVRSVRKGTYGVNVSASGLRFFPSYEIQADFANGNGTVSIVLVKQQGEWKIRRLRVSSEALKF